MRDRFLAPLVRARTITFLGCSWDDGWEYDGPTILYAPVRRHSGHYSGVAGLVEDVALDLVIEKPVRVDFHSSDLKEFNWRGWSPRGFARRQKARHVEIVLRFYRLAGEWTWSLVSERKRFGTVGPWRKVERGEREANEAYHA